MKGKKRKSKIKKIYILQNEFQNVKHITGYLTYISRLDQCFLTWGLKKPIKGSVGQGVNHITVNLVMAQFVIIHVFFLFLHHAYTMKI